MKVKFEAMWNKIKQYLRSWMDSLGEYARLEYGGGIEIKAPESKVRVRRPRKSLR